MTLAGPRCRLPTRLARRRLLLRHWDAEQRETLRVSGTGINLLAATRQRNQAAINAHAAQVSGVAREMQRAGRVVWRGLGLRAPLPGDDAATTWAMGMTDVYSIRHGLPRSVEPVLARTS